MDLNANSVVLDSDPDGHWADEFDGIINEYGLPLVHFETVLKAFNYMTAKEIDMGTAIGHDGDRYYDKVLTEYTDGWRIIWGIKGDKCTSKMALNFDDPLFSEYWPKWTWERYRVRDFRDVDFEVVVEDHRREFEALYEDLELDVPEDDDIQESRRSTNISRTWVKEEEPKKWEHVEDPMNPSIITFDDEGDPVEHVQMVGRSGHPKTPTNIEDYVNEEEWDIPEDSNGQQDGDNVGAE